MKLNKRQRKPKGQSIMDNSDIQATMDRTYRMKTNKTKNTTQKTKKKTPKTSPG